jgi:hypothetical protein
VLLLLLATVTAFAPDDPMEQVDFLRLSYKANKDAFAYGSFRFEFIRGSCASVSDAESGVFTRAFKEDGLLIFEGQNVRYELVARPEELTAAMKPKGDHLISSYITAFRMVTDGKATLVDSLFPDQAKTSLVHRPLVAPGTDRLHKQFEFPLYLGDNTPHALDLFTALTDVKNAKASLAELDFDSALDHRKVCRFALTWENGKSTFWIDVARGSVPLRVLDHYNTENQDYIYEFSDVEQVPNGGWLPRRMLKISDQGAQVERIVLTETDAEHRPPPSAFRLDFPKPTEVQDRVKNIVYRGQKSFSLLNPANPQSSATRPMHSPGYVPPSELPGEIEAGHSWGVIAGVGGIVLTMAAGIVFLMRRRARGA